ncbi:DUF3352 domain-containing protein [Pantanalinema sp. GBBB05]|uniref:DUF3352 domain-containing protein n=1 Tax=Pantanalinema sp. GBBB05 TaxID=2604139 RepID=UPI001DCA5810|nr:DUF3352 domain-containing protein [Pantanalinema sp. GBBB05]
MKLRSFFSVLLSLVVVLLLTGAGGFYWIIAQSPLNLLEGGQAATPEAAIFVPKQAPVVVSLLVEPERLESFRQTVARPAERQRTRAELEKFKQGLFASTGLNYQQDVEPWIGEEITFAVTALDLDRDRSNGTQPGYLLAMATKDPERSREFLQLFWQKQALIGTDLVFESYEGVNLIYGEQLQLQAIATAQSSDSAAETPAILPIPSLATALVADKFVLFANHPKVLREAINNVQAPDLNLSHASFYTQALGSMTHPRIGLTFVNLPSLANLLSGQSPERPATASAFESYKTLAIALELNPKGLLAETALQPISNEPIAATLMGPVAALQYIPLNSPLSASGANLAQLWTGLGDSLSRYTIVSQLIQQPLATLAKQWQIDLEQEIFSWVKGEYALGLVPQAVSPEEKSAATRKALKPTNDWIFVAQRSDPDAITHLDELAQQQGLSVGSFQLGEQTVSAWTKLTTTSRNNRTDKTLQAQVQGVHATVGDYEIFTSSLTAMDQALRSVESSLPTSDRFQQATEPLQQPNNGYFYLDWDASRPLLEQQFPLLRIVELAGKPIFSHLRSLTLSSYGSASGVQRGGVLIRLE